MKIKDILLTLLKSGENLSDHGMRVDVSGELGPMHGRDCSFCAAWADALYLLTESIALRDTFDPGNEVTIGDVTGIVEDVSIVYTVRLTGADGKRRYGRFASEYVSAPTVVPPADEYFSDRDGDIWQVSGPERPDMLMCIESDGAPTTIKGRPVVPKAFVVEQWGPLVPVKR